MGEEAKQPEQTKKEEKKEQKAEEKAEEKKEEEEANKPPAPFVLFVDLHCVGCAKKIERSILKIRGVENVVMDMALNQVTIKGVVDPQAVCATIHKKTKRGAQVLSPLPPAEGQPIPQLVASQVSGLTTLELNVNMHCEACAQQLKRKILRMKGVRTVETELSSGKVTVTGTMDADRLVEYVYRRTKKHAKVVPQPEPEKPKEEAKVEEEKPAAEEAKPEEKKEEAADNKDAAAAPAEDKKEVGDSGGADAAGKQEQDGGVNGGNNQQGGGDEMAMMMSSEEQSMQKMMYYYQPLYVIERIPPPQLFSDENPNACCIT